MTERFPGMSCISCGNPIDWTDAAVALPGHGEIIGYAHAACENAEADDRDGAHVGRQVVRSEAR